MAILAVTPMPYAWMAADEEAIKDLAADGVLVYAQQVPADGKTDLAAMIK